MDAQLFNVYSQVRWIPATELPQTKSVEVPIQAQGCEAPNIPHSAGGKSRNALYSQHLCVGQGVFSHTRLTCWDVQRPGRVASTPTMAQEEWQRISCCIENCVGWALWVLILQQWNSCSFSPFWTLWCAIRDVFTPQPFSQRAGTTFPSLHPAASCRDTAWKLQISHISALVAQERWRLGRAGGKKRNEQKML